MPKKILVVDDEPVIVKYLVLRLTSKGYTVVTARDGESAVEMARHERPDLVLLDVKLPKFNGYEVYRQIKASPGLEQTPIIFSTADATVKVAGDAEGVQAADYILKPFEPEDLFSKITKYV